MIVLNNRRTHLFSAGNVIDCVTFLLLQTIIDDVIREKVNYSI